MSKSTTVIKILEYSSDACNNWYFQKDERFPIGVKYCSHFIAQLTLSALTPIAILCDATAAITLLLYSLFKSGADATIHAKRSYGMLNDSLPNLLMIFLTVQRAIFPCDITDFSVPSAP
ncbi:MAG: hypothetical protein P4L16_06055 [Chlamydiales bacterium]|nr:hypothetical protein [Chlamydiales bacterium]